MGKRTACIKLPGAARPVPSKKTSTHLNSAGAALHHAAYAGHTEVVAKLVIAGSPVQHADVKGRTAAHLAAVYGGTEIVEKMLNAGYEVDMMGGACLGGGPLEQPHFHPPNSPEGSTVLHIAACHGHSKVSIQPACVVDGQEP